MIERASKMADLTKFDPVKADIAKLKELDAKMVFDINDPADWLVFFNF